jgi:hypothetical protein
MTAFRGTMPADEMSFGQRKENLFCGTFVWRFFILVGVSKSLPLPINFEVYAELERMLTAIRYSCIQEAGYAPDGMGKVPSSAGIAMDDSSALGSHRTPGLPKGHLCS